MDKIKNTLNALLYYAHGVIDLDDRGNKFTVERLDLVINDDDVYLTIGDDSPMKNHIVETSGYPGNVRLGKQITGETIISLLPNQHLALLDLLTSIQNIDSTKDQLRMLVKQIK